MTPFEQKFDDIFKNAVEDFDDEPLFDDDALWAKLQPQLPTKSRKKWYWLAGAACLLVVCVIYINQENEPLAGLPSDSIGFANPTLSDEKKTPAIRTKTNANRLNNSELSPRSVSPQTSSVKLPVKKQATVASSYITDEKIETPIIEPKKEFVLKEETKPVLILPEIKDSIKQTSTFATKVKKERKKLAIVHINEIDKYENSIAQNQELKPKEETKQPFLSYIKIKDESQPKLLSLITKK